MLWLTKSPLREDAEESALLSFGSKLPFWKCSVDDIIMSVSRDKVSKMSEHLNSISDNSIKLTVEVEKLGFHFSMFFSQV